MNNIKRVFISGTSLDLKRHHQAAIDVCNSLGFLPIDMSFFGAMDEDAVDGSKKQLETCNLYIGIIGFRYGYIPKGQEKSVTEIEFDHAGERGIERLCFLAHESHRFSQKVLDPENADKIKRLREKVSTTHIVGFFKNARDFRQQLTETLAKWGAPAEVDTPYNSSETKAIVLESGETLSALPVAKQLLGRTDLISQIEASLSKNDRILLHGYPGSGKTALAAEIVKRHVQEGKGRALWLEAGQKDTALLFESLTTPFGKEKLKSLLALAAGERISAMRHTLEDSKVTLLVVDDAWNWEALNSLIVAIPESIPLLVTSHSRYPLNTLLEITDLSLPDAVALLGNHAGADYHDDKDAETLCTMLGCHAFALEIIGRTLRVDELTPAEMIERLKSLDYKISEPVPGKTTRDTDTLLKASLDYLSEAELKTFLSFGALYTPTATAELLAFYLNERASLINEQLLSLQRRNLVRRYAHPHINDVVYYRIHNISYRYVSRHGTFNRAAVGDACRKYVESYQRKTHWLDIELNNISGAANEAKTQGNNELLVDILYMLTEDGKNTAYFDRRAPTGVITLFEAAAEAARLIAPRKAYYLFAKLAYTREQYTHELDQAISDYQVSLELARQLNEPLLEAKTLSRQAVIYFRKSDPRADELFARAEQMAKEHHDNRTLSLVLQNKAFRAASTGDYELGSKMAEEAADLAKDLDSYEEVYFWSLHTWGDCELNLGHLDRAQPILERARAVALGAGISRWLAYVYESLGDVQRKSGNIDAARQLLEQALSEWNHVGSKDDIDYIKSKIEELRSHSPSTHEI